MTFRSIYLRLCAVAALLLAVPVIALIQVDHANREQPSSTVLATSQSYRTRIDIPGIDSSRADLKTVEMDVGGTCPAGTASCPAAARAGSGQLGSLYPTLVPSASTMIAGVSIWTSPTLLQIAVAYGAMTLVAILLLIGVMRSIRHFHHSVEEVVLGRVADNALSDRNSLPEMVGISRLIDRLIADLRFATDQMRTASDDHAHALRTPLATIKTALHSVRRYTPADDQRAQRVVNAIDVSLDRMSVLIDSSQCNSQAVACIVVAARQRVDLVDLVQKAISKLGDQASVHGVRVVQHSSGPVPVEVNVEMFELMLENILMSAIESSPRQADVEVTTESRGGVSYLLVKDCLCSCSDVSLLLEPTFDALPPEGVSGACWPRLADVRRTIESMGGRASATANPTGGKTVTIELPSVGNSLVL